MQSHFGDEYAELAKIFNNLGILLIDFGKLDDAENYLKKALIIW